MVVTAFPKEHRRRNFLSQPVANALLLEIIAGGLMSLLNVFRRVFFCVAILLGGTAGVSAEGRHALVVGIDAYQNVTSLEKAVNDARAVKAALTTAGFEVQLVEGPDQISFLEAIAEFAAGIGPGDEAVVYYAGHGVEIDGRNYLLPSDVPAAEGGQEIVLTNRSIAVQDLVDALQARGARMSLFILDACRDNPFPRSGTRSIGGTRGLAPAPKAEGTFILYSAGEGETALDRLSTGDPNPNSVFTRALVPLISEPGLPLREVSRRVRSEVRQMALTVDHAQFPAVYDQLDGDFSFTVAGVGTGVVAVPDPCAAARHNWALVEKSDSAKVIEWFLVAYPGCPIPQVLAQYGKKFQFLVEAEMGVKLSISGFGSAAERTFQEITTKRVNYKGKTYLSILVDEDVVFASFAFWCVQDLSEKWSLPLQLGKQSGEVLCDRQPRDDGQGTYVFKARKPVESSAEQLRNLQTPSGDLIHNLVVLSDRSLDEIIMKIESNFGLEPVAAPMRRRSVSVHVQFDELRDKASQFRDREKFSASIVPFLQALRFAEKEFGPTSDGVAQVLNHFGSVFTGPGVTESQVIRRDIFYLCAEIYFENEGDDSPNGYLNALNSTSALRSVGSWVKAKEIVQEALSFYRKSDHLRFDYAMALQNYADIIAHEGDKLLAISLYQKVLKVIGESKGLASRNYLDAKMNLAWLLSDAGACGEAKIELETVRLITSKDSSLVTRLWTH